MLHPVRGLLLDLDETLLDDRTAVGEALCAFLLAHRQAWQHETHADALCRWRDASVRHWRRFEAGELDFQGQRRERIRDFLRVPLDDDAADRAFEPYVRAYEQSWRPVAECHDFLASTCHLPKVVITNGERTQQLAKLRTTGIAGHFIGVVTPADCGAWKPDGAIFRAGLVLLGLEAADCAMIGDDLAGDIEPARQLGMAAFHVNRAAGADLLAALAALAIAVP